MEPKRRILVAALILAACCIVDRTSAQVELSPSSYVDHALVFMDFSGVPGTVGRQQVRLCYGLLAQRLKVSEKELPHVFVIHASPEAAHAVDVSAITIRRIVIGQKSPYYEFWVVGRPQTTDYIRGFLTILEDHFKLYISTEERKDAALFVLRFMSSTVSAHGANSAAEHQ